MENKFYSVLEFDETEEGGGSFGYFGLMCDGEPTRILVRFNGSADRHGAMDVALELCDRWNGFEALQHTPQPSPQSDMVAVPREVVEIMNTVIKDLIFCLESGATYFSDDGAVYHNHKKALSMLQPYTKGE